MKEAKLFLKITILKPKIVINNLQLVFLQQVFNKIKNYF